ncbi:MAG: hypothetical protein JO356_20805 [Acidobacteria bacterium]|nr:hypothetical protein [Acidobacteriota bacterium]
MPGDCGAVEGDALAALLRQIGRMGGQSGQNDEALFVTVPVAPTSDLELAQSKPGFVGNRQGI